MPRVRGATAGKPAYNASPVKTLQIPLNDDDEEKAQRLQSRKALHSKQMDQLKAAASPARKRRSLGSDGPHTPSSHDPDVAGTAVTPMKRVPILANFEEWMKMATDNKINATNSWNFALIDYFHDMSLLKEGDGVNFQKASCTLDGCVKIYTSRVDSVATETGKLLSGLADSGNRKKRGAEGDGEEGEEEEGEEGEDGVKKRGKKKVQRSAEATLVNSFDQLRLKKMELEFSVDPLFKKASADFDEGGAKGLLLNHLSIDGTGRIVFDSSDDAREAETDEQSRRDSMEPEGDQTKAPAEEEAKTEDGPIDMASLAARFFPDLNVLDEQDVCPSLQAFELGAGDGALDLPFLKAPENWRDEHPEHNPDDEEQAQETVAPGGFGMDDSDNDAGVGADMAPDVGFGEGGEAWAKDAALQPQLMRVNHTAGSEVEDERGEVGTFDTDSAAYGVTLQHRNGEHDQENILNYFDTALHKNWAGPEHWKVAKIKDKQTAAQEPKKARKEKESFEIDFSAPMSQELASALYTTASSNSSISLPKAQWRSKGRNLLPDDKHFNSKDLLKLFLKPKARLGSRKQTTTRPAADGEVDEAYWAANNNAALQPANDDEAVRGDYDANFFQDDNPLLPPGAGDDDDDEFADAREAFSPDADGVDAAAGPIGAGIDDIATAATVPAEGAFGAQLIAQSRRLRPEYVQYARVAKKVDVRRLKEEMWRGIGFEGDDDDKPPQTPAKQPIPTLPKDEDGSLRFTSIMNNLQHVYPKQQMADISTSYGFICLLHLANEKGLVIENVQDWQDLVVRKDPAALVLEGGE